MAPVAPARLGRRARRPAPRAGTLPAHPAHGNGHAAALQPGALGEELGMLPTIAHELRSPVHALMAAVEILLDDLDRLEPPQVRAMLVRMYRQLLWQQGLLENLLTAATIPEGRLQLALRPLQLQDAVSEIEPILEPLLAHKNQRLVISVEEPVPEVLADSRRIGQVLVNLIQNASKFSPPETQIEACVTAQRDMVRVTVADQGPGLPPEGAQLLFVPFHRAAQPEQATKEGVGLGLAVVRAIVEAHGGQAGAEARPGGGACFWFELPAAPA